MPHIVHPTTEPTDPAAPGHADGEVHDGGTSFRPQKGRTLFSFILADTMRVSDFLRKETTSGILLFIAALLALGWSNSPWKQGYLWLHELPLGPAVFDLNLTVSEWCGDGLLAVFFFIAGLELKRECVVGNLRDPKRALLPVGAALGGMVTPALVYVLVNQDWLHTGVGVGKGWAIPTATDIAFALAVLALFNTHLPPALRVFLLVLAVVDDLVSILLIVVVFTDSLNWVALAVAACGLALFRFLMTREKPSGWIVIPVALLVWTATHMSGVHATAAGVAMAFMVPVASHPTTPCLAEKLQYRLHPYSAVLAVPLFAFFAAGVQIGGWEGIRDTLTDRIALGVILGLVVGKFVGVWGFTYLLSRGTRAELDPSLRWKEIAGVSLLAGVGFTVSLLMGNLVFGPYSPQAAHVKIGVLLGALVSTVLAGIVLGARNRTYRRAEQGEQ